MSTDDLTAEEFADGWALWGEHRPQSAEDWVAVAERTVADGDDGSAGHVLFHALCLAVAQRNQATEGK